MKQSRFCSNGVTGLIAGKKFLAIMLAPYKAVKDVNDNVWT